MNPYLRALMPTLFKSLIAVIFGAIAAFGVPLLRVISSVTDIASGEISVSEITGLFSVGVPIFIATATVIYLVWTFFQLIWAFFHRGGEKVIPARMDQEKIEEKADEIEAPPTGPQVPGENVDKYFGKYVKDEELHPRKEEENDE